MKTDHNKFQRKSGLLKHFSVYLLSGMQQPRCGFDCKTHVSKLNQKMLFKCFTVLVYQEKDYLR